MRARRSQDACRVHEHVEAAAPAHDVGDRGVDGRFVGHVEHAGAQELGETIGLGRLTRSFEAVGVDVDRVDRAFLGEQAQDGGLTDARRAAGDDDRPILEPLHRMCLSVWCEPDVDLRVVRQLRRPGRPVDVGAAADEQGVAGHVPALVAGEEHRDRRDVGLRVAEAPHGVRGFRLRLQLRVLREHARDAAVSAPGQITLATTPVGAHSRAADRVSVRSASLAVL